MFRTWGLLATCTIFGVLLAGCTKGAATEVEGGGVVMAVHDEASGSITGTVVSDAYEPLVGARVSLLTPNLTAAYMVAKTDEAGRFALNFVPADKYTVEAKAPGYQANRLQVEVREGEITKATTFVLNTGVDFQDVAFYIVDHLSKTIGGGTFKYGFECGVTPWQPVTGTTGAGTVDKFCIGGNTCVNATGQCTNVASGCMGSYSNDKTTPNGYGTSLGFVGGYRDFLLNHSSTWQTQLAELTWTQSSAVSGRGVLYEVLGPNVTNGGNVHTSRCGGINQSDPRDFLVLSDKPPIRLEINRQLIEERKIAPEDQCCDWRMRLFPGWCDLGNCARWGPDANLLGTVFPTRVDIYYTIFVKEPAPPGWSILGDK